MLFGMAGFQENYKWIATFLFFFTTSLGQWVFGCSSSSKELHICLNIYLERDFPLIETIVNGQQSTRYGGGRMILEGMDLDNICNHISSLYDCYWVLLPECDTLWKYDRFLRVMDVLKATRTHLCSGNKDNLKDLLLTSGCLVRARSHTSNCTGFDWMMTWRHVLRMQKSPSDTCGELQNYWGCLKNYLTDVICWPQASEYQKRGPKASEVFQDLMNVWLRHWCGKGLTAQEKKKYFYMVAEKSEEALRNSREELERRADLSQISHA